MAKLDLALIARLLDFSLKPYLSSPFVISKEGTARYYPRAKKLVYVLYVAVFLYAQFCLVFFVRPKKSFASAYHILGYLRGFIQTFLLSCVVIWNIHQSRHLFNAVSAVLALKNDLPLTEKQLRYALAAAVGEVVYAYAILYGSVSYVAARWGFGRVASAKFLLIFFEFNAFSGEIAFVNTLAALNKYSEMLISEMNTLKAAAAFDVVYIRDLIKSRKVESNRDKINRIRVLYGKIYDAKEELQMAFSFPLMVMTTTAFGNLVFFVFVNTLAFKFGTTIEMDKFIVSSTYPASVIFKVYVIVTVCQSFKEKLKEGKLVSTKLFAAAATEEETETVIALVQELTYMDPDITCHGFAVIDHELVSSMIGTIITYAVILLQTKFTDDGSDPVKSLLLEI